MKPGSGHKNCFLAFTAVVSRFSDRLVREVKRHTCFVDHINKTRKRSGGWLGCMLVVHRYLGFGETMRLTGKTDIRGYNKL